MFHRVFATTASQRANRREAVARKACVTFLCLFYLVSNTAISPSLDRGKNCRCADQVKTKSQCCCLNKSTANKSTANKSTANKSTTSKNTETKSCCSTRTQADRSCCSDQKKQNANLKTNSKHSQISSLCSCGNSAKDGLYSTAPRDLNPRPVLLTPDSLTIPLVIANVSPATFCYTPDTPPPQL